MGHADHLSTAACTPKMESGGSTIIVLGLLDFPHFLGPVVGMGWVGVFSRETSLFLIKKSQPRHLD
ncbi:hypothetical protein B0J18DRAFT_466234 [Chaetomium sp. MPI-SDFR-AT-0129]|nr:hypothetical protein B0J18DRAFT_466234 [Chaetomium sp. MPI-SDFR-AT-0129]